MFELRLA